MSECQEKLELVALDRLPFTADWFLYLHILCAIPDHTRFALGESLWVNLTENIAVRARPEQVLEAFEQTDQAASH